MSIRILKRNGSLTAFFQGDLGNESSCDLTPLLILGRDLNRFLKPIIDETGLKRPATIKSDLRKLKAFGEGLVSLNVTSLPKSESEWQQLVLSIHRFVITRSDRKASLQTRLASEWPSIRIFFLCLLESGIVPVSVYIPPVRENLSLIDISPYQGRLLGQIRSKVVDRTETINKLLVDISIARTDAQYLEEIRDTLAFRRRILFEALADYWCRIKANMAFGRDLIDSVDWPRLKLEIEASAKRYVEAHPANPRKGVEGLANYLAVIKHEYGGRPVSDDDLRKMNRQQNYLPRFATISPIQDWLSGTNAPPNFLDSDVQSARTILWWWQGRISHLDVSMLTALLIMLQPSWTPQAVLYAKVVNRQGKQYLELSDEGGSFALDKPRAKAMKVETLHPLSIEIVTTLIQESAQIRDKLAQELNPCSSLLFIPYGKKAVVRPSFEFAASYLSGASLRTRSVWIGTLYPELTKQGLGTGTISFSKIRKTEGVLEWFKTKSLKAASRKLGNTERVVLQHYVPKPLLDAWNTRLIRRFQNLWISVAAARETFLLEVTDFACLEDLHAFLTDILQLHPPNSSPLAEALHERFEALGTKSGCKQQYLEGHLHVAISESALSALYSYQANVIALGLNQATLDKTDMVTGLSPRHFLLLADLLQTRLPADKNPEFRGCHDSAMKFVASLSERHNWKTLFAHKAP